MIQFSSVAQYERNCHTYPMLKKLADQPGFVGTIGDFMLTASKHKIYLDCNLNAICKNYYLFIIVSPFHHFAGDDSDVGAKCKLRSSFYCDWLSSRVYFRQIVHHEQNLLLSSLLL